MLGRIARFVREALDHRGTMLRIASEGAAMQVAAQNEGWAQYAERRGNYALAARLRNSSRRAAASR